MDAEVEDGDAGQQRDAVRDDHEHQRVAVVALIEQAAFRTELVRLQEALEELPFAAARASAAQAAHEWGADSRAGDGGVFHRRAVERSALWRDSDPTQKRVLGCAVPWRPDDSRFRPERFVDRRCGGTVPAVAICGTVRTVAAVRGGSRIPQPSSGRAGAVLDLMGTAADRARHAARRWIVDLCHGCAYLC